MMDDEDLSRLGRTPPLAPSHAARERALAAAMDAFDEKIAPAAQGSRERARLSDRAMALWRFLMSRKLIASPAMAVLVALPLAGYSAFYLMDTSPLTLGRDAGVPAVAPQRKASPSAEMRKEVDQATDTQDSEATPAAPVAVMPAPEAATDAMANGGGAARSAAPNRAIAPLAAQQERMIAPPSPDADAFVGQQPNTERLTEFDTNPVKSALESPVSTFSIDVDTASYAFVRRSLKEGMLPQPDSVRVEEMVNYFPYDWPTPADRAEPFRSTVTVMPTPWNAGTKLMHIAIKGYDLPRAQAPKANLVFLIDVSGSMDAPDKLPLLKSSFRMLVDRLAADDTVSIVTYAGDAGTVLEPTKASDRAKIFAAIDTLAPGGSTAGEAGLREAYRLAQSSFVEGGVNRVMLATDGDFNVGQSDDDDLRRLIEEKRKSGVFLSVLGFGRGNLNDRMMQEIAQAGNGQAAYIDTLAEAEKALVEEASSTLFPIAKDVKIQVEFNPKTIAEYRLIGYETRALAREDFNDDRVDAGEIGAGHAVTAIYEITPTGSPARRIDDLRYGQAKTDNAAGIANADEYAFLKIRYKQPDGQESRLITTPVTASDEVQNFDTASADQRFSVAVAAFGQKLRGTSQVAGFGYDRISQITAAARGSDGFGYRAEFLSLVRLASALDGRR